MEQERIIREYQAREKRGAAGLYSMLRPANEFSVQRLERALLRCFARAGVHDLAPLEFMDIGCGTGGQLLRWIQWGARPEHCHGVDLVAERLDQARHRLAAAVVLRPGDASRLPYPDHSFDVTSQFTVLSSILDDAMQAAVAREMVRITKPGGLILSYDFWLNPVNTATRGMPLARMRELFPDCALQAERITLAPPIARRLAPVSPALCRILESCRVLNSHFLVMLRPHSHS